MLLACMLRGYDNLVAAIGEAVRCNRLVKEDWGYHIAGVVSDGFRCELT